MKFKNILNEAMVDTLPIKKLDKLILKLFHTTDIKTSEDFFAIASKYAISVNDVIVLFETYGKYKDVLFSEEGIEKVTNFNTKDYDKITRRLLLGYVDKNLNDVEIFNTNGITGNAGLMDELETMVDEEMAPEIWVSKTLKGTYTDKDGNETDEVNIHGGIYLNIIPTVKGYGYSFMNYNHEGMGSWVIEHGGNKYSDQLFTGYIKESFLPPLQNFKDEEVKRFMDQWIEITKKIFRKALPILERYEDYIEHGDSMFEGYKRKK